MRSRFVPALARGRGGLRWIAVLGAMCVVSRATNARAEVTLPPEVGWDYGAIETGRGAALSGAERAISNSIGALLSNPANMVASRVYHVGALASIWPEAARQTYGAAIVDSSTSSTGLAGGLSAAWTIQDADGLKRRGTDLRMALAFPFSQQFRMGIAAKYLAFRQEGDGPLGPSLVSGGLEDQSIVRNFGVDAGVTLQPQGGFSLSLVGTNLNSPGNGFLPTSVGGGLGLGTDEVSIEGDMVADFTTWDSNSWRAMGGGELLIADHFPLRLGYRYDDGSAMHWLSGGIGYIERSMTLEVGVRRSVGGGDATAIVLSFAYHVESAGLGNSSEGMY